MSERLERWKAAERVRSTIGWFAILQGIGGGLAIVAGAAILVFRPVEHRVELSGPLASTPFPEVLFILFGIVLLVLSRGLWLAKPWARWGTIGYCALSIAGSVFELVLHGEIGLGVAIPAFVLVYLLLPSTRRSFSRAQGTMA